MNFIEAVKLGIENCKKIKRDYWTCRYIRFVDFGNELEIVLRSDTGIRSREKKYIPTSTDIMATDWEVYEEELKKVNFQEALEALKDGKIIKRKDSMFYKNSDVKNGVFIKEYHYKNYKLMVNASIFTYEDVTSTDWIILDQQCLIDQIYVNVN